MHKLNLPCITELDLVVMCYNWGHKNTTVLYHAVENAVSFRLPRLHYRIFQPWNLELVPIIKPWSSFSRFAHFLLRIYVAMFSYGDKKDIHCVVAKPCAFPTKGIHNYFNTWLTALNKNPLIYSMRYVVFHLQPITWHELTYNTSIT